MANTNAYVAPGAGFTAATATLQANANDMAGIVTFTTASTIPASPYLIFTLSFGGSWAAQTTNTIVPVIFFGQMANPFSARTVPQAAAAAALGPFYAIMNSLMTSVAVYCTNAPSITTAYDIGYICVQGP